MKRLAVLALMVVGSGLGAPAWADATDDELAKMKGTWTLTAGERGGKPAPPDKIQEFKIAIEGKKITITVSGKSHSGTFAIDPGKKPKHFDLTLDAKTGLGIYELDGDTLKLLYDEPLKERPTEMKTKEGTRQTLMILKRDK
jgi:uncharacterized protein (TIGR03067 family)